jgi:protocatechuate 3,4-dioxygenase beta subunit
MSTTRHDHPQRGLSRRELIAAGSTLGLGAGLLALTRGGTARAVTALAAAPACVLAPEMTDGPYYIANHLVRRDITEGRPGLPLVLRLSVLAASTCSPIRGATVEVWHADALGVYSGFGSGTGRRFLRGAQRTDVRGRVSFRTIYPGWYRGRATHIHVKVHAGGQVVHTGQLFFDQLITDGVYRSAPYATHGQPDTTNGRDSIFAAGGARSTLSLHRRSGGGYDGALAMGVKV